MPTFHRLPRFKRDLGKLTTAQKERFRKKVMEEFVPGVEGGTFLPGLRVKPVQGAKAADGSTIFEMTWAPDGRATWQFGDAVNPGVRHVIWRRVGTHDDLFGSPPDV